MKTLFSQPLGRRFGADQRGNVGMMVALAIVPLTLASMGAVDLTRGIAAKVELQDALDAAALAAGRSSTLDPKQLQQIGQRILTQNLSGVTDFTVASSSFTFGDNGKVVASAQANYKPSFGGVTQISATTEVQRANNLLEIAMVLDNTGSMAQSSKLSYLKTAATNFVNAMQKAAGQSTESKAVQISLVPFSNTVRVGDTYRTAAWMDQDGVSPINNEIFTTAQGVTTVGNRWAYFAKIDAWRGCVEMRQAPYDIQDTAPASNDHASLFTPMFAPDEADDDDDRVNDYMKDSKVDAAGNPLTTWWAKQGDTTKYLLRSAKVTPSATVGPNAGCGLQPLQRLTTDFDGVRASIDKMTAVGETNIPMGLMWGWHTLSPNAPFADGVAYHTPKYKKIVVLMTDGENMLQQNSSNNNSTYSATGYVWQGRLIQDDGTALTSRDSSNSTRTAALDSRLKKLCANMKAPDVDIEIYTVGVGVSSDSKKLLQACASGADHYFDVSGGTDLNGAFQSIANQIAQLHLSK